MKANVSRTQNPAWYRALHWPIWIWVFFVLPGHLTQSLFQRGGDRQHAIWLGIVLLVTGARALRGRLPGVEARPYVTHFGEDKPNLTYRVVCYTAAWIDLLVPYAINVIGLVLASLSGAWLLPDLWRWLYYPLAGAIALATFLDLVPRAKRSTWNEGAERARFYLALWTVVPTQIVAWAAWRLAAAAALDGIELARLRLAVFVLTSLVLLIAGWRGKLPRTTPYFAPRASAANAPGIAATPSGAS